MAHCLFRNFGFSHCHQVGQVVFRVSVAAVVVEAHPFLCTCSEYVDTLLCHFGNEDSHLFDVHEPLPGVFLSQRTPCYAQGNTTPHFFSSRTSVGGFLISCCISSTVASEYPSFAILAIVKAGRLLDCSSCTRSPCLAIVTDMLKTYK